MLSHTVPIKSQNLSIEKDMLEGGVNRFRSKVDSSRRRESECETAYGQRLLKAAIPPLVKGLEDWEKQQEKAPIAGNAYYKLQTLPTKTAAFISLKSILDSITQKRSLASAAVRIGALIEDECRFQSFSNHPQWKGILKGAKRRESYRKKRYYLIKSEKGEASKGDTEEWERWGTRIKLHVGTVLIEQIRVTTGLVDYVMVQTNKRGPARFVTASATTAQWIEDMMTDNELLCPFWMPLIDFPKQWKDKWSGGYDIETGLPPLPFIKTRDKTFLRENTEPMTDVMNAVNLLQNTPWKTNDRVLQTLDTAWNNGIEIDGLPSREDELIPPFPSDDCDPIEKKMWKRRAAAMYDFNAATKSRRLLVLNTLGLAKKYVGKNFYLPHQTDFRGRCYAVPSYVNHMGADFQKSLLTFARGEKVKHEGDVEWLAIHGANCYGIKGTYQMRVDWVENNRHKIQAIAKDPFSRIEFWRECDEPFQFLAFCFEWSDYMDKGKGFVTHLPCAMDASNNGLQLLGILTRDEQSCEATNVTPSDYPQDIYGIVSDRAIELLKEDGESEYADPWLKSNMIDRATSKRPCMTQSYGSTPYSCRQYVAEWYDGKARKMEVAPFDETDKFQATAYLSSKIWQSINDVVGKPREAMAWLQSTARTLAAEDKPFYWVSPSGFPCYQSYQKWETKSIKTKIGDKIMRVRFREDTDKMCAKRQAQGASPNYIHSLDASCLHSTVNQSAQNFNVRDFAMVHDSYGTHSTKCNELSATIRDVFVKQFTPDLLQNLKDSIEDEHGVKLNPLPTKGTFNINNIYKSEYIFS
tara:strand:- start:6920 stop:9340 length:2421 start_codon:yes stop_codon:yes gene_type:complete